LSVGEAYQRSGTTSSDRVPMTVRLLKMEERRQLATRLGRIDVHQLTMSAATRPISRISRNDEDLRVWGPSSSCDSEGGTADYGELGGAMVVVVAEMGQQQGPRRA
jgi:hypothetical protein